MTAPMHCGIFNVDKPFGWTSHNIVGLVRRLAGQRQVGHAGTLDPRATGVLLVMVGAATRLSDYLMHGRKCYLARVTLGVRTATDDGEGEIVEIRSTETVTRERVVAALGAFRGAISQLPPTFSAIKQGGVPAYRKARSGAPPQLTPREVRIEAVALTAMAGDVLDILVWCSAGTYIRSLARDLGESLGCGAHLAALRRLSSGAFTVRDAYGVGELRRLAADGALGEALWPPDVAVSTLPTVIVDTEMVDAVLHGKSAPAAASSGASEARILSADGRLLALAEFDRLTDAWQPRKVLVGRSTITATSRSRAEGIQS